MHNGLFTGFLLIRLLHSATPSFPFRTFPICVDPLESAPVIHPSNSNLPLEKQYFAASFNCILSFINHTVHTYSARDPVQHLLSTTFRRSTKTSFATFNRLQRFFRQSSFDYCHTVSITSLRVCDRGSRSTSKLGA